MDEQVRVQNNVQHNDLQNNIIDDNVSNESNESMYNNRNEIAMDHGTTTKNIDEKECDDIRKEGETTIVSEMDDTDIGQV